MSCFKRLETKIKLMLSPAHLGDISGGIKKEMQKLVLRYIPNLEGILIAWESFELQDTTLAIRGDIYSVVEVPISATLLIWAPKPGSILRGKVVKMGTDYVALTIFNLWSASITKKYVPFDFNFSPEVFKQGEYVQFKVRRLVVNHGLVSLKGSLEGENCGIVNAQNEIEQPKVSPSGLARKHHVPESPRLSSIADPTDDDEPPTVLVSKKRKSTGDGPSKTKKHKTTEE